MRPAPGKTPVKKAIDRDLTHLQLLTKKAKTSESAVVVQPPLRKDTRFQQDYWEHGPGSGIRVHVKPRRQLFVPMGTKSGPDVNLKLISMHAG